MQAYELEFIELPGNSGISNSIPFSKSERSIIDHEIDILLEKGAIRECSHVEGEFLSNIFIRQKKSGDFRVILNLKKLNTVIKYEHFKMEHIDHVTDLVFKDDYMASIDLKDAYFSINLHESDRKYVRFFWNHKLYEYCCLCFGYAAAPRLFTKITKPILAHLHELGIKASMYIDDLLLIDKCSGKLTRSLHYTMELLHSLGFTVNKKKSVLTPTKKIRHLGFVINSVDMNLSLPKEKISNLQNFTNEILTEKEITIRKVAQLTGLLVSCCKGAMWGRMFYRDIDRDKALALKTNRGNFDKTMKLSEEAKENIKWWLESKNLKPCPLNIEKPSVHLQADASLAGWGCANVLAKESTGGRWKETESQLHINLLELKAAWLGVQSFCSRLSNACIHIELDNATAICYINNMGGTKANLDHLAKDFWTWLKSRNLYVTASHIPGVDNSIADRKSRVFHDPTEWSLNSNTFNLIVDKLGKPNVDLFASRLNNKCEAYFSWEPDPQATNVDAFSVDWSQFSLCYAFPPFNLITKVIRKMVHDQAELLLVAPKWTTQVWFPMIETYICKQNTPNTLEFANSKQLLYLPFKSAATHSLWHRLNLCCFRLSGKQ